MDKIIKALKYPDQTIKDSFLFTKEKIEKIELNYNNIENSIVNNKKYDLSSELYLLSYGSNASISYLNEKFDKQVELPIIYFKLNNYIYSIC